jgi:hypothetical protein
VAPLAAAVARQAAAEVAGRGTPQAEVGAAAAVASTKLREGYGRTKEETDSLYGGADPAAVADARLALPPPPASPAASPSPRSPQRGEHKVV